MRERNEEIVPTDDASVVRAAFDALFYKAEHNDLTEDGYDPRTLREITAEFTERANEHIPTAPTTGPDTTETKGR